MTSTVLQDERQQRLFRAEAPSSYDERRAALIDFFADRGPEGYLNRVGFIEAAARLHQNRPVDEVRAILDPLLGKPQGAMFWMYPMTLIQYLGQDAFSAEYQARLRDLWRTFTPYRGDTENHWAMYYTSLYLMAQLYPDEPGRCWFTGKTSAENFAEAEDYLLHWMRLTTTRGQGEFDSPHYIGCYVAPMAMLCAFAEDPAMRTRAEMMLDYLLADFAADSLNGLYTGAFSRIYPLPTLERWRNGSTTLAWLLFGNVPFRPDGVNAVLDMPGYRPHGMAAVLAMSGYEPPAILQEIATDRSEPYVHRELKRTRHRIRYSDERNAPVYKYLYMREGYALGSIQGGLLQPIQQHTWELQWATDTPKEGHNMLFTIHPYSSGYELAMYFPEEPRTMREAVLKSKGTYDSPGKWSGASPYEEVVQSKDALIALYDIPPETRFPHISGYFSKELTRREEDDSGWIFAKGGDALIAYYPLAEYEWQEEEGKGWRLFSPHLKNGAVVQVAPASAYATFEAFKTAVRALPLETSTRPTPAVTFTTLRGDRIAFTYGETPEINGAPVDYAGWPLYDGPFMQAEPGSKKLELMHGNQHRLLDFEAISIKEWIDQ